MKKQLILLALLLLMLISCMQNISFRENDSNFLINGNDYLVSTNALFANLSEYNLFTTKASNESKIPLSTLLDYNNQAHKSYNDSTAYTIIPFLNNSKDSLYLYSITLPNEGELHSIDSTLLLLNYFVHQSTNSQEYDYVITLMAQSNYFQKHNCSASDILNLTDYTGYIIYSNCDQTYFASRYYYKGTIYKSRLSPPLNNNGFLCKAYTIETKGEILPPAVCVTTRKTSTQISFMPDIRPIIGSDNPDDYLDNLYDNGIGGGKSGINDNGTSDDTKKLAECTVTLYSSDKDKGSVSGAGTFPLGKYITIKAIPQQDNLVLKKTKFSYWLGDLAEYGSEIHLKLSSDISSTAYFDFIGEEQNHPCLDLQKNISNFLSDMQIAPTSSGRISSGLYGANRINKDGNTSIHEGLDFAAQIGTPVYSSVSGTIIEIRSHYEDGITASGLGNRVIIYSNGKYYLYCHLRGGGHTVGFNCRENRNFEVGDKVYAGELIAYSGKTGNAYNVDNAHVHFEVRDANGERIDPSDYLNGIIDSETGLLISINCDNYNSIQEYD